MQSGLIKPPLTYCTVTRIKPLFMGEAEHLGDRTLELDLEPIPELLAAFVKIIE
jgi:hypothetical protein